MLRLSSAASAILLLAPFCVTGADLWSDLLASQHWLQLVLMILTTAWLLRSLLRQTVSMDAGTVFLTMGCLALLTIAFFRDSVWFAKAAFCFAAALSAAAAPGRPRARILILLLVVCAGPPPLLARPAVAAISERILTQISTSASLLQVWNYRAAEAVVTTQAGTVNLQTVLATPFGYVGLSALLVGWLVYRKRTVLQVLLTLPFAIPAAILNYGCAGLLAVLATETSLPQIPIWCWPALLLLPTALFLLSAEQLILLLTGAIIPLGRKTDGPLMKNPFNRLWDQMLSGRTAEMVGEVRLLDNSRRRLTSDAVFSEFLKDWFCSRKMHRLPGAVPAILLTLAVPFTNVMLLNQSDATLTHYQRQLQLAAERQDPAQQELLLRGLAAQRPSDLSLRLQLADFLWTQRSKEAGWAEYENIARQNAIGAADANLWIARNAMSPAPFRRLSDQQLVQHLQQALQTGKDNAEAHSLLARLYLQAGELAMGERQLRLAADADLTCLDELLTFCRNRSRPFPPPQKIQQRLQQLKQQLESRPDNEDSRLRLVTLLVILDNPDEAERVLNAGLQGQDSVTLKRTAAELQLYRVRQQIFSPQMTGDESLLGVRKALQLDPASEQAPLLAALLHLEGAQFNPYADAALQHWQSAVQQSAAPAALQALALLQFACDRPVESIATFSRLPQKSTADATVIIAALIQTGRSAEALSEAHAAAAPLLASGTVANRIAAAELFSQATAFAEGRKCLDSPGSSPADARLLSNARSRLAIDELDALIGHPGHFQTLAQAWIPQAPEDAAGRLPPLIETGLESTELAPRVADRLYLLTLQGGTLGTIAEESLSVHRARGGNAEGILIAIGSRALQVEQFDSALYWLELARKSSVKPTATLLNNLAIAIVRSGRQDRYPEALELANSALQDLPGNHMVLATRAEVYLALNEPRLARQDLDAALQLRPDYVETLQLLATTAERQGESQQAAEFRQRAATLLQE